MTARTELSGRLIDNGLTMKKREDGRKLVVRRERLRDLANLTVDEARQVAGGLVVAPWKGIDLLLPDGRVGSRCCV